MKKLIIVLMMVAMASFLLVGCLPGTTTPETPTEPTEPTEPVVPTTVAPIITAITGISLTSTATQYINNTEASLVVVSGTAPTYSEAKIYIDGICAGTGDVGAPGTFAVVIAKADLGTDGAKTLYATATEAGLAESAHSTEYAFTLDTVKPGITSIAATANSAFVNTTVVPVHAVLGGGTDPLLAGALGILLTGTGTYLAPGVWTVVVDATALLVTATSPAGVAGAATTFALATGANNLIPGLNLIFTGGPYVAGDACKITVVGGTSAIAGRATLKFSEDVTSGAANAGTYASNIGVIAAPPFVFKESNDTGYWTGLTLALNATMVIRVSGVADLAGNVITALSSASCIVGPASLTSLAP